METQIESTLDLATLRERAQAADAGIEYVPKNGIKQESTVPVAEKKSADFSKERKTSSFLENEGQKPEKEVEDKAPQTIDSAELPENLEIKKSEEQDVRKKEWSDKDKKRYDRNWEKYESDKAKFNEEKEKFRLTQIELEQKEARLRSEYDAMREKLSIYEAERPDVVHLTSDFFRQEAQKAIENGDMDAYRENTKRADELDSQLSSWKKRQEEERYKFNHARSYYKKEIVSQWPDIEKPDSPLREKAVGIYKAHENIFGSMPDGEWQAVYLADLQLKADSASSWEEKCNELQKKLEETNEKLNLSSSAKQVSARKNPEDLSSEDFFKDLRQRARELDSMKV